MHIDPVHVDYDIFSQEITLDVWRDKYRYGDEAHPRESMARVTRAIMGHESSVWENTCLAAMQRGFWMPGGRIQAGAGTDRAVTLHNCYVNGTLEDSMEGIFHEGVPNTAFTLKQGGGIGTDFTPLRPRRSKLKTLGEGAMSSGAVSFMKVWDATCATIMSAGYRRGAMMGTLAVHHPDIEEFIEAKHTQGELTNFNLSVLVTDAFMQAVANDEDWYLYHAEPSIDDPEGYLGYYSANGTQYYVHKVLPARQLWDKIIRSTWKYSEPGVIFIDRVNTLNNLKYCETISCTNPCGEQPLPPNGACDLGAVNLARLVLDPFSPNARIDWSTLGNVVGMGVRFLDNVIDISRYPLKAQEEEQKAKRRIGLGISGLGSALIQLGVRYGSPESVNLVQKIMYRIARDAYTASVGLAKEKGTFPLWKAYEFLNSPFLKKLPKDLVNGIKQSGIRNGVLLTIAPVGTNSLYYGNCSSGLEPVFSFRGKRKIRQPDGSWRTYDYAEYAYELYHRMKDAEPGSIELPDYFTSAADLTVDDHLAIQAACQGYVDASVSKTINCPKDISFKDFELVYLKAYETGCKGCTTYTPSDVRGSILESTDSGATSASATAPKETLRPAEPAQSEIPQSQKQERRTEEFQEKMVSLMAKPIEEFLKDKLHPRPAVMSGKTYKIKWPSRDGALYVTINDRDGRPYEIFINSRSSENAEWMTALTRMISSVMRQADDISFIAEELMQVASSHDSSWVNGRFYASLVAYLGYVIKCHTENEDPNTKKESHKEGTPELAAAGRSEEFKQANPISAMEIDEAAFLGIKCPKCLAPTLVKQEGCESCLQCGYSTCG